VLELWGRNQLKAEVRENYCPGLTLGRRFRYFCRLLLAGGG
jgi:hypothetical protein